MNGDVLRGWADWYVSRRWTPTPIALYEKGPRLSGWSRLRLADGVLTLDGAPVSLDEFDGPGNIGILTGAVSDGLADVDLDDPSGDVQALAPAFLPDTMTFGRASKRRSHWLYRCKPAGHKGWSILRLDADGAPVLDADGKRITETLLELRSNGNQTMAPPSVHPSGEPVEWSEGLDLGATVPLEVDRLDLEERCRRLAVAALLVREGMGRGEAAEVADAAREASGEALRDRLRFEVHRTAVAKWFGLAGAPVEVPRAPSRAGELDGSNERPGDWLARNVSWGEILTPHGWTESTPINGHPSWRRPGKTEGERSAYVSGDGARLFVKSTNAAPLEADEDYDKIGALARLEGITVGAAARLVRERFGMPAATSRPDRTTQEIAPAHRVSHTGGGAFIEDGSRAPAGAPVVASTKSAVAPAFEAPPDLYRHKFSADPDHKPNPRQWLLVDADGHGTIPAGEVGLLIAAGGTGKTMALVQLAATVAGCAVPWLGTATEGARAKDGWRLDKRPEGGDAFGRVLLVMAEEDFDEMDRRRHRFLWAAAEGDKRRYGTLAEAFAARVVPYPLPGERCALTGAADKHSPEQPTPWSTAFREMLAADAKEKGQDWRLIILDPATRFMGPDGETDNKAATEWTREVARLALNLPGRPSVVVAHHKNKGATKDGSQEQTGARGSSALTDGARFQLDLARDGDGVLALVLAKGNYSKAATKLRLVFDDAGYLRPITKAELDRNALDKATEAAFAKLVKTATDADAVKAANARAKEMGLDVKDDSPGPDPKKGKAKSAAAAGGGDRVRVHG